MKSRQHNFAHEIKLAKSLFRHLPKRAIHALEGLLRRHRLSVSNGDLKYLDCGWYITHSGLLRLAQRRHCAAIHSRPVLKASDPARSHWIFKAVVFKSRLCKGFFGYGDANPANVSPLVHGAEMRIAETRAVNRALRKAYGIGICSVEEIGSLSSQPASRQESKKVPQSGNGNGNFGGRTVRDRLCQL